MPDANPPATLPATLGLDIGGTCIKAALLENGRVVGTFVTSRYRRPDRATLLRAVGEAVAGATQRKAGPEPASPTCYLPETDLDPQEGSRSQLAGVGISVPGVLSEDRRRVLLSANVPGLQEIDLPDLWSNLAPGGAVTTDQIAAAVDYASLHNIRGRLLSIAIGTGVGAAVLDCTEQHPLGIPLRVNGDSPGHLGQLDVSLSDNPPIGPDGGAGSVEAYLGAAALGSIDPAGLGIEDVPLRALVRLLRVSHALYRPNHIALLGGIGLRLSHLAVPLQERVNDRLTNLARPGWVLGFGSDDFHAARGVARLAAEASGD